MQIPQQHCKLVEICAVNIYVIYFSATLMFFFLFFFLFFFFLFWLLLFYLCCSMFSISRVLFYLAIAISILFVALTLVKNCCGERKLKILILLNCCYVIRCGEEVRYVSVVPGRISHYSLDKSPTNISQGHFWCRLCAPTRPPHARCDITATDNRQPTTGNRQLPATAIRHT